jgi:hypothetical protein
MADTDTVAQAKQLAALAYPQSDSTQSGYSAARLNYQQRHFIRAVPADASAASTGIYRIFKADRACTVVSATLCDEAAVASNTSNYVTYTLIQDNDAASATTTVSTTTGVNTSGAAQVAQSSVAVPMNATVANLNIAAGGALYCQVAKAGAGVSRTLQTVVDVIVEFTGP